MSLLEELGQSWGTVAQQMAEYAKQFTELTKLRAAIAVENRAQDRLYAQLGEELYHRDKDNPASPHGELCAQVTQSRARVARLQQQLEELGGIQELEPEPSGAQEPPPAPIVVEAQEVPPPQQGPWYQPMDEAASQLFRPESTVANS